MKLVDYHSETKPEPLIRLLSEEENGSAVQAAEFSKIYKTVEELRREKGERTAVDDRCKCALCESLALKASTMSRKAVEGHIRKRCVFLLFCYLFFDDTIL